MRKIIIILLLTVCLLPTTVAGVKHWGGFSVGGGVSLLQPSSTDDIKNKVGGVLDGAVLYELEKDHFLFHTGFGVSYAMNKSNLSVAPFAASITEYSTLLYRYKTYQFTESSTIFQGYLPLMMGGKFNRFYFLAGAKLGFIHTNKHTDKAEVEIYGTDDDVIDEMHDLYTHSMGLKKFESGKQSYDMSLPIMASAEIGTYLKQTSTCDIRLSLWMDYMINQLYSLKANSNNLAYTMDAIDVLKPQSAYGTNGNEKTKLHQIQLGAKLTFLFSNGKTRHHSICHWCDY